LQNSFAITRNETRAHILLFDILVGPEKEHKIIEEALRVALGRLYLRARRDCSSVGFIRLDLYGGLAHICCAI
jgi:hypothetical protein